jgi:hypothetical protein
MKKILKFILLALVLSFGASAHASDLSKSVIGFGSALPMKIQGRIFNLPMASSGMATLMKSGGQMHLIKNLTIVPSFGSRHAGFRMSLSF